MNQPDNDPGKRPDDTESLRQAELRRMVQEYIANMRKLIKKLRRKLH